MAGVRKTNKRTKRQGNVRILKCATPHCKRKPVGSLCYTCQSRKYRAADPMKYAYYTLRDNVYRRKGRNFWGLTFEEFKQYAVETKYITGKGKSKTSYTIDAKDPTMGYFIGNIRTISNSHNSKKRRMVLTYDYVPELGRMVATLTKNTPPIMKTNKTIITQKNLFRI